MKIEIKEESLATFREYAGIAIAFKVDKVFDIKELRNDSGKFSLIERVLPVPYVKDYDAISGEHPVQWAKRFDISNWGVFAAWTEGKRIGGAVVVFDTPELAVLEEHRDLALLWDIRVAPEARRHGVGSALLQAVESWAKARGCRQLKVETQNINVTACTFYAQHKFTLTTVNRFAYPDLPDEIQLFWYKELSD
jgi:GNAT superfamily N-acetyltransferase